MSKYDEHTVTRDGHGFTVEFHHDADLGPPWEEHDGHGPVRQNTLRDKRAGEVVIHNHRDYFTFYDFAEATRIAKRDGWGLSPEDEASLANDLGRVPTRKQIAREAVLRDMARMRGWCRDDWHWMGIIVKDGSGREASLWGIESDIDGPYQTEIENELAGQIVAEITDDEMDFASSPC